MITIRKAADRGSFDFGWLDTRHTFSFGDYHDPAHMGFRSLRVLNEDRVKPGQGFGTHGHRDMEIITWVLSGGLEHKDSLGTAGVLKPGDVQRMSAGTGIRHSEYNASDRDPVHFLQIWIVPDRQGAPPRYEDRHFPLEERRNRLRLIVSQDEAEGSLSLYRDVRVYAMTLEAGKEVSRDIGPGRGVWVQAASGALELGQGSPGDGKGAEAAESVVLTAGDGASLTGTKRLVLRARQEAEVLVFDLG